MDKRKNPNEPMSDETIACLRRMMDELGADRAADVAGISLPTFGRALAGMPVARSVRRLVEARLRERAADGAA